MLPAAEATENEQAVTVLSFLRARIRLLALGSATAAWGLLRRRAAMVVMLCAPLRRLHVS